jgi:hypothetical protein
MGTMTVERSWRRLEVANYSTSATLVMFVYFASSDLDSSAEVIKETGGLGGLFALFSFLPFLPFPADAILYVTRGASVSYLYILFG